MNKKDVQKRVLKDGKPLPLEDFTWCEKSKTFSSNVDGLVLDFNGVDGVTFKTGWECTFKTGSECTFNTGSDCTFDTGSDCTFKTGSGCTFKTGSYCTFKTESCCIFDTGSYCTFKTGSYCTFNTSPECNFKTGSCCTFKTGSGCTFKTGYECVIVRRDVCQVIQPNAYDKIELFPLDQEGNLTNGMYKGEPHIIADGIVSKIINQKGGVYKVKNLGEDKESWLIKDGDTYAHGQTLKEARADLLYKAKDRDASAYKEYTLDTVVTHADALKMYRTITGACSSGMKHFVEQNGDKVKDEYTVAELIELTAGAYNSDRFKQFFKGEYR